MSPPPHAPPHTDHQPPHPPRPSTQQARPVGPTEMCFLFTLENITVCNGSNKQNVLKRLRTPPPPAPRPAPRPPPPHGVRDKTATSLHCMVLALIPEAEKSLPLQSECGFISGSDTRVELRWTETGSLWSFHGGETHSDLRTQGKAIGWTDRCHGTFYIIVKNTDKPRHIKKTKHFKDT